MKSLLVTVKLLIPDVDSSAVNLNSAVKPNSGWPLVREKSGKFDFSSRLGKSQGILQIDQGNFKYQGSPGKVREFHNFGPKYVLQQVFRLLEKC